MTDRERETVRRVLEALLAKLDGEIDDDGQGGSIVLPVGVDRATPVIVVVELNPPVQNKAEPTRFRVDEPGATANGSASGQETRQASHPGLERFPLPEIQSQSSVPRACFMEPGRACINSGACEMRGY